MKILRYIILQTILFCYIFSYHLTFHIKNTTTGSVFDPAILLIIMHTLLCYMTCQSNKEIREYGLIMIMAMYVGTFIGDILFTSQNECYEKYGGHRLKFAFYPKFCEFPDEINFLSFCLRRYITKTL